MPINGNNPRNGTVWNYLPAKVLVLDSYQAGEIRSTRIFPAARAFSSAWP